VLPEEERGGRDKSTENPLSLTTRGKGGRVEEARNEKTMKRKGGGGAWFLFTLYH